MVCGIRNRKLTIINHNGKFRVLVRSFRNKNKHAVFTAIFRKKDNPTPRIMTVEEMKPGEIEGINLLSQEARRQTLQIRATRMKNNKFCIS
jgi:hypothetical protein